MFKYTTKKQRIIFLLSAIIVLFGFLLHYSITLAQHSNTDAPAILTEHNIPVLFPVPSVASVKSGNWSDPAIWSPARVPVVGDDVHVLGGHTVIYNIGSDVALRSLSVFGTLGFSRTVDTKLHVGYTLVHPGGYLQIGTPADPIPVGRRAEIVIADQSIDLTRDPLQWGTGINVLGRIDIAGAPLSKTFVRLTREPMAGDTTLTLAEAVTGWQSGDRLIVPDTRRVDYDMRTGQWGNPPFSYFIDDVKIVSVSGTTVTLQSALKYDHFASYLGKRGAGGVPEFYPHVVNLSRNIVVRSANPAGTRGQVSFLDRARVDVRYAEFVDLGRTRGEVPLGSPDPTRPGYSNQVGRYPVHLHHLKGPLTTDLDKPQYQGTNYQAIILGNSTHHEVSNPPKGWYTIHQTHYSLIQDNVGYNAHGVGYYFEDGSERENLVKRNIGIRVNGHAGRVDSDQNNPATDGTIFYFKGPMNRVIDNVAANANAYGMIFFFKYAGKWFAPPTPGAEYTQQFDLNATPLTEVRGNEAYGAMVNGMAVWWLNLFGSPQYSQPNAPMSVVKDFTVWHVQDYGVFNYEVQSLTWDHPVIRGDETRPGNVGMYFADYYQINSRILNPDIQGVNTGILKPFITSFAGEVGVTTIEGTGGGCFFKNKVNVATYTPWHNSGGAGARTPSQLVVRNCKFAYSSVGPASEQYHLYRQVIARDVSNYATLDSMVVYDFNQVAGDNFAVYYEEQNPAAIMPASSGNIVGSPEAGLTNQQTWAKYGVALAGAVAPCTTLRAGIEGYACALSGATPPPVVAPTVSITSPSAGATITGTSVTANFSTSGDRTQADHLHLQLDALPEVRGIALDGSYTFTNVVAGSHTLRVYLAKADHTALTNAGASATVTFTTVSATAPPASTGQLGNATVAGSVDNGDSNYISAVRFTMPNVAGTATAMSVYIGSPVGTAPNNQFSLAIYADAQGTPGARVANTANGTIAPVAWNTLPITAALAPNATYWLAYNTNGTAPNQNNFYIAPGLTNQLTWIASPFGSWPATAGRPLGSSNHTASIYVAYTSGTTPPPACTPNWQCTNWSACTLGTQTRTCTDTNVCGVTTNKPVETHDCMAIGNGSMVKLATDPKVYLIENGLRRWIVDAYTFTALGYTDSQILTVTQAELNQFPAGPDLKLTCTPNWQCTWSACASTGTQTCPYTDLNSCGTTTGKPTDQTRTCTYTPPSSGTVPSVSSVSGTVSHGSSITITGGNFGAKPQAQPYIWDDASGPQTAVRSATPNYGPWDFAYPYTNDPAFRLAYRKPSEVTKANGVVGGVPLPHNHISRYLAGAHYNSGPTDTHAGYNVAAGKNNQQGQPYTYISYYLRVDPSWQFDAGDHNFKEYDYAAGNGYMGDGPNSYFSLYDINQSNASWAANYIEGMNVAIRRVNTALVEWYPQYDTVFSTTSSPSPVQAWRKFEFILKHNDSTDGVHYIFQDNVPEWEVHLDDDGVSSPAARAETVFGGYAREAGNAEVYKNNWRYYADVYYDHSWARVMLANNANYSAATVIEPQPPVSWADGTISAKVNLGKLQDIGTAYLFVFNANGTRNATGFPVTLGGATLPPTCTPNWQCTGFGVCVNGAQTQTCTDTNNCGVSINKPVESQGCTVVAPPPTGSGLVASYGFNEGSGTTATDSSGNGHVGALAGPTWIATGKNGGALNFDGVNDRVNVASTPKLELATAFTISAWAYPTNVIGWRTVAMKGAADYDLYTSAVNNFPGTQASIAGDWRELFGPFTLATNAWVHIAGTYDGAAQRLYVNGVEVASRAQTGAIRTSTNPLTIGGNVNWGEYFAGRLDDVRVYSRALSATEITSDMNTSVGTSSVPPPVFSEKIITNPSLTRLGTHTVAESSGLVASRVYPGIYWMIGDSGNPASIYAVNSTGRLVKSFAVSGSTNIDWEDIALDENNNIWIADAGDNSQTRVNYVLYRVPEPNPTGNLVSVTATAFKFIYPDGKKDSEGVFIWQNIPYVIQKRPANARVYKFPEINASKTVTLEFVGEFKNNNNWITGADISRDGRRLALINDGADYHWIVERALGSISINDFFIAPINQWRIQFSNNQGEAIGFVDGSYDFVVASETGDFWKIAQSVYDSGAAPEDTVAPVILNSSPSGILSADTQSTALTVATSESSVCRYAITSNTSFALMTGNFTQITPTSHSANIAGLVNGASYVYYVRCHDTAGNVMLADYNITFRVAQSVSSNGARFAVIGDYGWAGAPERDVADLVKNSNPDFIITTGDNNYDNGGASSIDANIGQYYHDYIFPYNGSFGTGAQTNKFFPSLGNHDWGSPGAVPYLNYFALPGNERYYDFIRGPIHFFAIDSDPSEPDGITSTSRQALWLKDKLANSASRLQIVYFHHSPYSSATTHGSTPALQWPFKDWGADLVLSGHDHTYERLSVNGFTYLVVGTGGKSLYPFGTPLSSSQVRYNSDYGALIGEADQTKVTFTFMNRAGAVIDTFNVPLQQSSTCTPAWSCTGFGACTNGTQTQVCTDLNNCGVNTSKPAESQSCSTSSTNLINISFTIKLEGRSIIPIRDFTMAFYHTVTGAKVAELTAKPDPSTGKILLPSTIVLPKQEYDVVISISGYLKKRLRINPDSNTTIELPLLPAGDFNDDNIINTIDYSLMNAKWFNADAIMDINGDGMVNSLDFSILNRNWNRTGD